MGDCNYNFVRRLDDLLLLLVTQVYFMSGSFEAKRSLNNSRSNGSIVRNSVIDPSEIAATGMNGRFSGCGAADGFGERLCCTCSVGNRGMSAVGLLC